MPVKIQGLPELERRLVQLPRKVAQKQLSNAVRKGALPVRRDMKTRANKTKDTGKLQANIYYFKVRGRNTPYTVSYAVGVRSAGIFYGREGWRSGKPKDDPRNAYYWTFIEFGTKHQRAQPFVRPAFESQKQEADREIRKNLLVGIEKEALRLR